MFIMLSSRLTKIPYLSGLSARSGQGRPHSLRPDAFVIQKFHVQNLFTLPALNVTDDT